ncbi:MAG: PorV/PorQ family protein, partial [Elusimicrobiota bacterium]
MDKNKGRNWERSSSPRVERNPWTLRALLNALSHLKNLPYVVVCLSLVFHVVVYTPRLDAGASGGEPGRFMSYGAGGRPLAMGGAFYAIADDATAAYWNPAGLGVLERKEFTAMYAQLFAETTLGFIAYAHPLPGKGTIGVTYTQLTSGGFEKVRLVTDANGNITDLITEGTFEDSQSGLGLAWGKAISGKLSLGFSGKMLRRQLDTSADSHLSMDVTSLARNLLPNYQLGFGIHNALAMKSGDTDDRLPLTIRVGNSYKLIKNKLGIGLDFDMSAHSGTSWKFGGEYWLLNWIAFRFGLQGDPGGGGSGGPREMNFGAGLNYQNFSLDLANAIHELGLTTRFSGTWRFGAS